MPTIGTVNKLLSWNGNLAIAGSTTGLYNFETRGVTGFGTGLGLGVGAGTGYTLAITSNNDLVVGGLFTTAGGTTANNIAVWNGSAWSPLGSGTVGVDNSVAAIAKLSNGDLVVGGTFSNAGGSAASRIARWNGTSWSAFGTGISGTVIAIHPLASGAFVVGGIFSAVDGVSASNIAHWNGSAWSALGTGTNGTVKTITTGLSGNLLVGGDFTSAGGSGATAFAVWTWSTSSWAPIFSGSALANVHAITPLSNGDFVVGGSFGSAPPTGGDRLMLFDGTSQHFFGNLGVSGGSVSSIVETRDGDLVVGGSFSSGSVVGLWPFSKCLASAIGFGAACASSVGTHVRVSTSLPQIGQTFQSTTDAMPAASFAMQAIGFGTTSVATSTLFPGVGFPTCLVTNTADVVNGPFFPALGEVQCTLALPFSSTLIGGVLHEQELIFETDNAGVNVLAVTVNQGLTLTIGLF